MVALVLEIFLALTILAIVTARTEKGFQTITHEFLEIPIVGMLQKFHEGLQHDVVHDKARQRA